MLNKNTITNKVLLIIILLTVINMPFIKFQYSCTAFAKSSYNCSFFPFLTGILIYPWYEMMDIDNTQDVTGNPPHDELIKYYVSIAINSVILILLLYTITEKTKFSQIGIALSLIYFYIVISIMFSPIDSNIYSTSLDKFFPLILLTMPTSFIALTIGFFIIALIVIPLSISLPNYSYMFFIIFEFLAYVAILFCTLLNTLILYKIGKKFENNKNTKKNNYKDSMIN